MKINSYAAYSAKKALEKFEYEPKELGPKDIEVAITHCGICHSDIHLIDNDWQMSSYPLVPGHEIVGTVKVVGSQVTNHKVGDRVGIGWQRSACLECESCIKGDENLCSKNQATCVGNYGGFAEFIRTDSNFAFRIPDGLSSENTAPLLCGGITVFSPLKLYVKPQMHVGIIGVGGLGHMAVQFAKAFGCEVTVFSSSANKLEETIKFGAHNFILSTDKSQMKKAVKSLDFILTTATANLDWENYLSMLKPDGRLTFVGAPSEPIKVSVFSLIGGRKTISGSPIGGRTTMNEMLEFVVRHDIAAKTESVPLIEVNAAIERVRQNKARYRMVLKNK